jgi:hypothetical protein
MSAEDKRTDKERLDAIEKLLKEALAPKPVPVDQEKPLALDFADEKSRHVYQNNQRQIQKLSSDSTALGHYLGIVESFGLSMTNIPMNIKDLSVALVVNWRTIFGSWDGAIQHIGPQRGIERWLAKNMKWLGFFASVIILGSVFLLKVFNPQESLILSQDFANMSWMQEAALGGGMVAVVIIVYFAYRSWSKKTKKEEGS